jgi:hypothetical protein
MLVKWLGCPPGSSKTCNSCLPLSLNESICMTRPRFGQSNDFSLLQNLLTKLTITSRYYPPGTNAMVQYTKTPRLSGVADPEDVDVYWKLHRSSRSTTAQLRELFSSKGIHSRKQRRNHDCSHCIPTTRKAYFHKEHTTSRNSEGSVSNAVSQHLNYRPLWAITVVSYTLQAAKQRRYLNDY